MGIYAGILTPPLAVNLRDGMHRGAKREQVGLRAKPRDDAAARRRYHTGPPKRFTRKHVGEMHFNDGDADRRDRVGNCVGIVRKSAGVKHDGLCVAACSMQGVDDFPFSAMLHDIQLHAQFGAEFAELRIDLVQCFRPVLLRVALPRQIEVRSMNDCNAHASLFGEETELP